MKAFWDSWGERMGAPARNGLFAGLAAIVLATVAAGFWLLRADYQPLFTEMSPQDASAMTAELDRQKIPYQLGEQVDAAGRRSHSILVERSDVHRTRIKLMGKDIPLHGAVGFELFNNSDLGMTEFAQKINYQRALQGELTRTILALDEIRDARVLLALPEQGLFKQAASKPKASVTLGLKPERRLRSEQIGGIQRLVAAAVPGIAAQDVTIVDQSGVALTRSGAEGADADGAGTASLDLKKDTETYLARKATAVLERALGEGEASASVDVTLDMDRVQTHTDELVGAPSRPGGAPTGLVTRERETVRDVGAPLGGNGASGGGSAAGGSNQREVEYALGHRVERVSSQPGSVRRIQVAVVVRKSLSTAQQEPLRAMVAAAVGANMERGDTVVVQSAEGFASPPAADSEPAAMTTMARAAPTASTAASEPEADFAGEPLCRGWCETVRWWSAQEGLSLAMAGAALGAIVLFALMAWRARGRPLQATVPLSDRDRQELLATLTRWLQPNDAPGEGERGANPAEGVR